MTLDQLQVLVTIIERGSFRAASEALHRAQSAVSYAVRELEAEIGQPLFDRSTYRPQLTPAGRVVLAQARQVLFEESRLKDLANILKAGVEPHLRVAIAAIFPIGRVQVALCDFRQQFPHTQLSLISDVLGADRRLLADEVDLAISETLANSPEIESQPIGDVTMWPVISAAHPEAGKLRSVRAAELKDILQIVVMSSVGGEDRSQGVLRASNAWRVSDFSTKHELILAGLGWGRMPVDWVLDEVKSGALLRLNDDMLYRVPMMLTRRRSKVRGPAAEALWQCFTDATGKEA